MIVRIEKDWIYPDIFRQTPKGSGLWNGIQFTTDEISTCDYFVALNRPSKRIIINCPKNNKWLFIQEPPVADYKWLTKSYPYFDRVYTFDYEGDPSKYISSQTALPWHVNKTYDELTDLKVGKKDDRVSWITSNAVTKPGHVLRMQFKDFLISNDFKFDLFGKGFQPIADKFDGIYPYKYSIAIENHHTNDYWTEKIADCFLSWSMPIYYGCKNITKYFPEQSMLIIDPADPQRALEKIQNAVKNNLWERNLKYIEEARNLVLNKYQFFPWITSLINESNFDSSNFVYQKYVIPANLPPSSNIFDIIKNKFPALRK